MKPYKSVYSPALLGLAFQQTAVVGMLPVLAMHLQLSEKQIGLTIGSSLTIAAILGIVFSKYVSLKFLRSALILSVFASMLLIFLMIWPQFSILTLFILFTARIIHSLTTVLIMNNLQSQSINFEQPVKFLSALQIAPTIGRILGTAMLGLLIKVSIILPFIPTLVGSFMSLIKSHKLEDGIKIPDDPEWPNLDYKKLAIPFLLQCAIGAAQLGLSPMLAETYTPLMAASLAGICLTAGYISLFVSYRFLNGITINTHVCVLALAFVLILPAIFSNFIVLIFTSIFASILSALILPRNLAEHLKKQPSFANKIPALQTALQMAGIGIGATIASALLGISTAYPFILAGTFIIFILLFFRSSINAY